MSTRREKLRPFVEGGASVHDLHFLCEAKSTHLGGGGEGLRPGEDLPPDGVVHPLILQLPHVGGQGGLGPLAGVLEVGLVVVYYRYMIYFRAHIDNTVDYLNTIYLIFDIIFRYVQHCIYFMIML